MTAVATAICTKDAEISSQSRQIRDANIAIRSSSISPGGETNFAVNTRPAMRPIQKKESSHCAATTGPTAYRVANTGTHAPIDASIPP